MSYCGGPQCLPTPILEMHSQVGTSIDSRFQASMEEINDRLDEDGFGAIAKRTYDHYRKLHRFGYERYVPINQLDIETHRTPIWGSTLLNRHRPHAANLNAELVIALDGVLALSGNAVSISVAEIVLSLDVRSSGVVREIQLGSATLEGNRLC